MRHGIIPPPVGAGVALPNTEAVKDWVHTLIARFVATTTQTVTPDLNPSLVGLITLKFVTMLSHCLVYTQPPTMMMFHQVKGGEASALLAYLEGQARWGDTSVSAGSGTTHSVAVFTRKGKHKVGYDPKWNEEFD